MCVKNLVTLIGNPYFCSESFLQRITKHEMVVKNFLCMLDSYEYTYDVILVYGGFYALKMTTSNHQIDVVIDPMIGSKFGREVSSHVPRNEMASDSRVCFSHAVI